MRDNFNKAFKRKRVIAALLACFGGACIGLALTGALMLVFKLTAIELGWYIYVIMGVCAAALSGTALFFIIRSDELKVAKSLDKTYALGEKAQTLVEFEGQESPILNLQREDAEAAIAAIKYKKPSAKSVLLSLAAVLVCAALFTSGVMVEQRRAIAEVPVDDQPFEMTDTQTRLLNLLIENVDGDTVMDADLKSEHLALLNDLYDYLTGGSATNGGMVVEVQYTMLQISACTFASNTYDNFITAFNEADGGTAFASAFYDGATVYKSSSNIDSYETVKTKRSNLADSLSDIFDEMVADIKEMTDATEIATNLGSTLESYITLFSTALGAEDALTVPENDGLYSAIETLSTEFLRYNNYYVNSYLTNIDAYHSGLSAALDTFASKAANAMYGQTYSCIMDEYERQTLSDVFGVVIQGLSNPEPNAADDGSGNSGNVNQGGTGGGETLYGSDDEIFDPSDGTYKSYGEMLSAETNSYLNRLYSALSDDDLSDEVKSYIREYISSLLGSSGE